MPEQNENALPIGPDHPDNVEIVLVDDAEIDALIEGVSTEAPVLANWDGEV